MCRFHLRMDGGGGGINNLALWDSQMVFVDFNNIFWKYFSNLLEYYCSVLKNAYLFLDIYR